MNERDAGAALREPRAHLDAAPWAADLARAFQEEHGVYTILRLQYKRPTVIAFKNGRLDSVQESESEGAGVQLFNREGESVIGSTNDVTEPEVAALLRRSLAVLRSSKGRLKGRNTEIWSAPKLERRRILSPERRFDAIGLTACREALREHHERMRQAPEGAEDLSVASTILNIEEEWRILRGDGSALHWNVPRFALIDSFTVRRDGRASQTRTNIHGGDLSPLFDDATRERFEDEARRYRDLAFALQGAPRVSGGSYKIVIDAILAKGLAHEAFGHAAESDAIRFQSILGEDERFRTGLKVCKESISIIDESIEGDWAYAPYSANGLERAPVAIVKNGVLQASLADVYTAESIGVAPTGAARLESYGDTPIPRMSNIRLDIADALPWEDPRDSDPEKLHRYLLDKGLMEAEEEVLFLTGYTGGQVNPKLGDYVFNCQAIYRFKDGNTTLHQPGLFSGKVLETLESITAGIGPLRIHHLGTCGKAGQGVPSSGGGPLFTVIDKHPHINIGGR